MKEENKLTPEQLKELTEAIAKSLPPMFDDHADFNTFFRSTPDDYEDPQDYSDINDEFESWKLSSGLQTREENNPNHR